MGYERRSVWTFNRRGSPPYTSITRRRFLGMGAGSSSFAGRDFYVNHFGVTAYAEAVEAGRLARRAVAAPGPLGRGGLRRLLAGLRRRRRRRRSGRRPTAAPSLPRHAPASPRSWPSGSCAATRRGYRLTRRGFDAYHDLERLVTYQLIEPLWAEMLTEHAADGECAAWATPQRARAGRVWSLTSRLLERC